MGCIFRTEIDKETEQGARYRQARGQVSLRRSRVDEEPERTE